MVSVQELLDQLTDPAARVVPAAQSEALSALMERCRAKDLTLSESLQIARALAREFRVESMRYRDVHSDLILFLVAEHPVAEVAEALLSAADVVPATAHSQLIRSLVRIGTSVPDESIVARALALLERWAATFETDLPIDPLYFLLRRPMFATVVLPVLERLADHDVLLDHVEQLRTTYLVQGMVPDELSFSTNYTPERLRALYADDNESLRWIAVNQCSARISETSLEYEVVTGLPKVLSVPYIASNLEAQIMNGGINQYFWNSTRSFAVQAVDALVDLGLLDLAKVVKESVDTWMEHQDELRALQQRPDPNAFTESYELDIFNDLDEKFAAIYERRTISEALDEYLGDRIAPLAAVLAGETIDEAAYDAIAAPAKTPRAATAPPSVVNVIALHGSPDLPIYWSKIGKQLNVEMETPLLAGHSYSDTPRWGFSIERQAAQLRSTPLTLIAGYSWGGLVALALASTNPTAGLFLVEPVLVGELSGGLGAKTEYLLSEYVEAAKQKKPEAVRAMVDLWFGPDAWPSMHQSQRDFLIERTLNNAADVEAALKFFPDLTSFVARELPMRVVVGSTSPEPMQEICRSIVSKVPTAELIVIERATHALLDTHRGEIAKHLQAFADSLGATIASP